MEMCIPYHGPPQAGSSCLCSQGGTGQSQQSPFPHLRYLLPALPWVQDPQPWALPPAGSAEPLFGLATLPVCPRGGAGAGQEDRSSYHPQQMPRNTLTCHHLLLPGLLTAGLSNGPDIWYLYTLSQTFLGPQSVCPSRWDGVDTAMVKWKKVVKLFCIRCVAVNLEWQEAHSGQFLCPVQKVMTFPDWKHDPMHLTDDCSHRLNCTNLLNKR